MGNTQFLIAGPSPDNLVGRKFGTGEEFPVAGVELEHAGFHYITGEIHSKFEKIFSRFILTCPRPSGGRICAVILAVCTLVEADSRGESLCSIFVHVYASVSPDTCA